MYSARLREDHAAFIVTVGMWEYDGRGDVHFVHR